MSPGAQMSMTFEEVGNENVKDRSEKEDEAKATMLRRRGGESWRRRRRERKSWSWSLRMSGVVGPSVRPSCLVVRSRPNGCRKGRRGRWRRRQRRFPGAARGQPRRRATATGPAQSLTLVRVVDPTLRDARSFNGSPRGDLSDAPRSVNPRSWERDFSSRSKLRIRGRERETHSFRARGR